MGTLVLQERAQWLTLANLKDREQDNMLDSPIVPEGLFGSVLASMQQRCEVKHKEDESLQLRFPWKAPAPLPATRWKEFTPGPRAS